jgi:hypothetical protein
MSNALDIFDEVPTRPTDPSSVPSMMTAPQRDAIRSGFAELGVSTATDQFAMVLELTGRHITSVAQLEARHAQTLIYGLEEKVRTLGRKNTGSAWDDREEDTWIDKR